MLKLEVLQDPEHLQGGDAASTRRWHAIHGVSTIGALKRLALLGLIGRKVRSGEVTRTRRVLPDGLYHVRNELAAVKRLGTLGSHQPQYTRVVRVM